MSFIFLVTKPNRFFTSAFLEFSLSALIKSLFAWDHFFFDIDERELLRRLSTLSFDLLFFFVLLSVVAAGAGSEYGSAPIAGELDSPRVTRAMRVIFRIFDVFILLFTIKPVFDLGKFLIFGRRINCLTTLLLHHFESKYHCGSWRKNRFRFYIVLWHLLVPQFLKLLDQKS